MNEQTAFFEEQLAETILPALYTRPDRIGDELAASLRRFQNEERQHTKMFRRLSHKVDPTRFSLQGRRYHFIRVAPWWLGLMNLIASHPWQFAYWIWLVLLQEERSIAVSKACIQDTSLDWNFRHTHLTHIRDEKNHVNWDLQIIESIWKPRSARFKAVNVRLFRWLMREFFTAPKRSAKAVVQALIDDYPQLKPAKPRFFSELKHLKHNKAYHESLYSRSHTPRAFALFDGLPEFDGLETTLLGYESP